MKIKRTALTLVLASSCLTPHVSAIDPLAATIALATGLVGAGLTYNYAYYHSNDNCRNALNELHAKLTQPDATMRAAYEQSLHPLLPVYGKLVKQEYDYNRSLHISALSRKVAQKAHAETVAPLQKEQESLKNYAHYWAQEHALLREQCQQRLNLIQNFYQQLNDNCTPYPQTLHHTMHALFSLLENDLRTALNKQHHPTKYPVHEQLKLVEYAFGVYQKYTTDNNLTAYDVSHLIHHTQDLINALKTSEQYKLEKKEKEIDRLQAAVYALEEEVRSQKRQNSNLREENSSLTRRNRDLREENSQLRSRSERLQEVLKRLKGFHYCPLCDGHIKPCLYEFN